MDGNGHNHVVTTTEELERLYSDAPYGPAVFKEADRIRDELRAMGIELEDKKDGTTTWRVKR